jgi:hypothetical protein
MADMLEFTNRDQLETLAAYLFPHRLRIPFQTAPMTYSKKAIK